MFKIFKDQADYFKDNPEGLWFKRKLYGWGWTPVRWQGWATIFIYAALVARAFVMVDTRSHSNSDTLIGVALPFLILTAILFFICYKKGEKPKWMWGPDKKD